MRFIVAVTESATTRGETVIVEPPIEKNRALSPNTALSACTSHWTELMYSLNAEASSHMVFSHLQSK